VERATSSEPDERLRTPLSRLPIRVRLATGVAIVAFAIFAIVAVAVGTLTVRRLRGDFQNQVLTQAQNVASDIHPTGSGNWFSGYTDINNEVIRVFSDSGSALAATNGAPNLGPPLQSPAQVDGYWVVTQQAARGPWAVQYALPLNSLRSEIGNLELLLTLGVLAGTILAFGAGSLVARRAIMPIAELTAAAAEIERTRDPSGTLPEPTAEDEVAELTRTLGSMLAALAAARDESDALLDRQRAFVADASHELRTPLTSVLANLELLVDSLAGADREAAESALRSTQRMRRLVGDLLLLARADAGRVPTREPVDLADVVVEAASELEPSSNEHVIVLDVHPTRLHGSRDDLQRVATNLIENALRHTPPGTHITASTRSLPDGAAELVVADDGPGISPDVREQLFERFVRGAGDRGGSFGLGLAIVQAVVTAHGGTVTVDESPHSGARFTVRLPQTSEEPVPELPPSLWAGSTAPTPHVSSEARG
jgi:two-component system, OmpR family, sensor kinase